MNLIEMLRRPEGKTLEFKRDLSSPDGLLRTVVAFAKRIAVKVVDVYGNESTVVKELSA